MRLRWVRLHDHFGPGDGLLLHTQQIENMGAWNRLAKLLQKSLQVFFGALLSVETDFMVMRLLAAGDFVGHRVVGVGLAHPLGRQLFHRELCPSS